MADNAIMCFGFGDGNDEDVDVENNNLETKRKDRFCLEFT